jgi:hypothetical protein
MGVPLKISHCEYANSLGWLMSDRLRRGLGSSIRAGNGPQPIRMRQRLLAGAGPVGAAARAHRRLPPCPPLTEPGATTRQAPRRRARRSGRPVHVQRSTLESYQARKTTDRVTARRNEGDKQCSSSRVAHVTRSRQIFSAIRTD